MFGKVINWLRRGSIGAPDATYRFTDPLRFHKVARPQDLLGDAVFIEREATTNQPYSVGPSFHDFVEPPILPDLRITHDPVSPPAFILARENVRLSGYRLFTDDRGRFHLDESYPTPEMRSDETGHFGSELFHLHEASGFQDAARGAYTLHVDGRPVIEVDEPIAFIGANEGPNFGSFMFRVLPKVAAVRRLHPDIKVMVPLYPDALRDHLVAAGIENSRIVRHDFEKVYRFRQVFIPSLRNRTLWMDDETKALFADLRDRVAPDGSHRRLYLTRAMIPPAGGGGRILINEGEVRDLLTSFGFETLAPETLSIESQIAAYAAASHIVAPGGSALYNAAFCQPGTKYIDIEAEPFWARGHIRWLESAGLDYGVFEGTPTREFSVPHQPFSVDIRRLRDRLNAFL